MASSWASGSASAFAQSGIDHNPPTMPSPRRCSYPARTPEPSTCSTSGSANAGEQIAQDPPIVLLVLNHQYSFAHATLAPLSVLTGSFIVKVADGFQHCLEVKRGIDRLRDFAERLQLADRAPKLIGALAQLAQQARILDRDTRAAKFVSSPICFSLNGRTSRRQTTSAPTCSSSFNIGMASTVRTPPSSTAAIMAGSLRST